MKHATNTSSKYEGNYLSNASCYIIIIVTLRKVKSYKKFLLHFPYINLSNLKKTF